MRTSHPTIRGIATKVNRAVWLRKTACILAVLAFVLGGPAETSRVLAARPADTQISFGISISPPADPICVGEDRPYKVTITKVNEVLEGSKGWKVYAAPGFNGLAVDSGILDQSIGSVSPRTLTTGWDKNGPPGEVTFTFHAAKAGRTQLYFETLTPLYGGDYLEAKEPVKVVNCKYKVNMNHRASWTAPGGVAGGSDSGSVAMTISGESGEMTGTGTMNFAVNVWTTFCSSGGFSIAPVPITVNGHASDTDLELSLDYPATDIGGGSFNCPFIGTQTGFGSKPLSDFLAFKSASLPAEGGTVTYSFGCLSGAGSCSLTISAEPLEDAQAAAALRAFLGARGY